MSPRITNRSLVYLLSFPILAIVAAIVRGLAPDPDARWPSMDALLGELVRVRRRRVALDRAEAVGSLEPGRLMDAVLVQDDLAELVRVGAPAIRMVIKRGRVVWSA